MTYISQITMCALHLNTVVCQLYLNITGPKNFLWENKKEKWPSCFCKNNICSLWRVLKWRKLWIKIVSVRFSRSVVSDSLWSHESQHARPPCPSPTPGVHSNSRPSSRWYHPAISSSVSPSPLAHNPSQHQSLFQWVNSSHEVAKVLEFQL